MVGSSLGRPPDPSSAPSFASISIALVDSSQVAWVLFWRATSSSKVTTLRLGKFPSEQYFRSSLIIFSELSGSLATTPGLTLAMWRLLTSGPTDRAPSRSLSMAEGSRTSLPSSSGLEK